MSRNSQQKHRRLYVRPPRAQVSAEMLLQPWFLMARVQRAITALVPPSYREKMRDFYEDYGCMICGGDRGHYANGMCSVCNNLIRRKLRASALRRLAKTEPRRVDFKLLSQAKLAKRLLGSFRSESVTGPKTRSAFGSFQNPVDLVIGTCRHRPR